MNFTFEVGPSFFISKRYLPKLWSKWLRTTKVHSETLILIHKSFTKKVPIRGSNNTPVHSETLLTLFFWLRKKKIYIYILP